MSIPNAWIRGGSVFQSQELLAGNLLEDPSFPQARWHERHLQLAAGPLIRSYGCDCHLRAMY